MELIPGVRETVARLRQDGKRLAIEDTQRGIDSATAAGVRCFACTSPMTKGTVFEGAVAVLASVGDVPVTVQRLEEIG